MQIIVRNPYSIEIPPLPLDERDQYNRRLRSEINDPRFEKKHHVRERSLTPENLQVSDYKDKKFLEKKHTDNPGKI